MRVFSLPQKIYNQIEKLNRNFLWGHSKSSKKTHLISWNKISKSKKGGLRLKNKSLKCIFYGKSDLETKKHKLWVTFFLSKYKRSNSLTVCPNSSFIYKGIFKDKGLFSNNTSFLIKNEKDINL